MHHPHVRKGHPKDKTLTMFVYGATIASLSMTVHQAYLIFRNQSAENVSLATWITYGVVSFIWLAYGIKRNDKPVFLSNIGWILLSIIISFGIILYG